MDTSPIPATPKATVATAANSTTLEALARSQRNAKLAIAILATLGTLAISLVTFAPWNFVAAVALFLAAVVVAWLTNSLKPEEVDTLVRQLTDAAARVQLPTPPKGGDK
jgi:hypothetical protein